MKGWPDVNPRGFGDPAKRFWPVILVASSVRDACRMLDDLVNVEPTREGK